MLHSLLYDPLYVLRVAPAICSLPPQTFNEAAGRLLQLSFSILKSLGLFLLLCVSKETLFSYLSSAKDEILPSCDYWHSLSLTSSSFPLTIGGGEVGVAKLRFSWLPESPFWWLGGGSCWTSKGQYHLKNPSRRVSSVHRREWEQGSQPPQDIYW